VPFRLRDDLSFCRVEDHLIFLDIGNDQYFRLSSPMERAFLAYHSGERSTDISSLIAHNLLTDAPPSQDWPPAPIIPAPIRSALESNPLPRTARLTTLLETFSVVFSTQWQLKARGLVSTLTSATRLRKRNMSADAATGEDHSEKLLLEASADFVRARPYIPIETCCLLDSISMLKILARKRLHANLVFGVTSAPFSAHCWLQEGDLVLNDTVGNAKANTPIRVL